MEIAGQDLHDCLYMHLVMERCPLPQTLTKISKKMDGCSKLNKVSPRLPGKIHKGMMGPWQNKRRGHTKCQDVHQRAAAQASCAGAAGWTLTQTAGSLPAWGARSRWGVYHSRAANGFVAYDLSPPNMHVYSRLFPAR